MKTNISGTWNKDSIQKLLLNNDRALERAVVVIFNRQTDTEKANHRTQENNCIGFNSFDADFYSSIAQQINSGKRLSNRVKFILRKSTKTGQPGGICKYWKQLLDEVAKKNN